MKRLPIVSVSIGNIKCQIGKSLFAGKSSVLLLEMMTLEVFKFLHYLIRIGSHHAGEILNQIVCSEVYKILTFLTKKREFFKDHFDKALMPFCKTFIQLKQLFHGKPSIFRLLSFSVSKNLVVRHALPC